jgi:hypothetical protein
VEVLEGKNIGAKKRTKSSPTPIKIIPYLKNSNIPKGPTPGGEKKKEQTRRGGEEPTKGRGPPRRAAKPKGTNIKKGQN